MIQHAGSMHSSATPPCTTLAGSGPSMLNVVRAGCHQGELEIEYDSGEVVYGNLMGMGSELDISLSTQAVNLLPAYVHKQSQSVCRQVIA